MLPVTSDNPETTMKTDLYTTEQLEQWKDQVARWWGAEHLRYDHKKTALLFQQWFGVSKQQAVEMEFNSRDEPERFIEEFLVPHQG